MNESSNVILELPQEFKDKKINPTFHTNLVWPYIKNDDILFPKRDTKVFYDFGNDEDQEWLVEEILAHQYIKQAGFWLMSGFRSALVSNASMQCKPRV